MAADSSWYACVIRRLRITGSAIAAIRSTSSGVTGRLGGEGLDTVPQSSDASPATPGEVSGRGTLAGPWQAPDPGEPSWRPSSSVPSSLGCGPAASPSSSAAAPSVVASATGIVLQRTEAIGCDTIGIDYTSATIKIDAASDPDVWAETESGKKLAVNWTAGFTATDAGAPVIAGPKGEEVARDGTRIDVPADGSYPRLVGYFVCLAPDALYILETVPQ